MSEIIKLEQISTTSSSMSRAVPKAFTEKGDTMVEKLKAKILK